MIAIVKSKKIARSAIPSIPEDNVTGINRRETHLPRRLALHKNQAPCLFCQKLYRLYREGPFGRNTKLFTSFIDCFRLRRNARRSILPSTSSKSIQSLQNCSNLQISLMQSMSLHHHPRPTKLLSLHSNVIVQIILSNKVS